MSKANDLASLISDGLIGTAELDTGAVTLAKLSDNSVDATKLDDTDSYVIAGLDVSGGQIHDVASLYRGASATTQGGIGLGTDGSVSFMNADAEGARFSGEGRLGLGTQSPLGIIDIEDSLTPMIKMSYGGTTADHKVAWDSAGMVIAADTGATSELSYISMQVFGNEALKIKSSGNVGLGIANPAHKLDVAGGIGIAGTEVITSTGQVVTAQLQDSGVAAGSYGSAAQVPVITVDAKGRVTSASTTAVAGVSSTDYNTSTGVLTINTSDGGSFTEDLGVGTADTPQFTQLTLSGTDAFTITNTTARIRAATNLELVIDYDNNNLGSLLVKNGGGTAVTTIDESGNAGFTGVVTADTGLHVKSGNVYLLDSTSTNDVLIGWAGGTYNDPGYNQVNGISLRYGGGTGIVVSKDDSETPYNYYSYRYGTSWSNGHHMQFVNGGTSVGTIESDSSDALVIGSTSAITLKTASNSNSVIIDGALNSLWPVRNDVMDLGRSSNRWQDLYLSSVIDSNRQGNSGYGNMMLGSTTDNSTKWASLRVRHYNNSVETEGFAFISAASSASQNAVFVGGGLDEENVATDIFMNVGSTQAVRGNVDVEVFRANITEAVFNENSYDRDFRVESNNKTHMLFVDGTYDRVGVGTEAPAQQFHSKKAGGCAIVGDGNDNFFGNYSSGDYLNVGNLGSTGIVYLDARGASTDVDIYYRAKGTGGEHRWSNSNGSTLLMTLTSAGNLTVTGDVTANSDIRLKSDIQTITNAVETVKSLRGTAYIKDGKASIGVIAQEIEEVLPQVVHTADDEMGTKSVAYGNIIAVLIEAIKEQQDQIDELKKLLETK